MISRTWLPGQAGNWEQFGWPDLMSTVSSCNGWPGSVRIRILSCALKGYIYFSEAWLCSGFNSLLLKRNKKLFGRGGSKSGMDRKKVGATMECRQSEAAGLGDLQTKERTGRNSRDC